VAQKTIVTLIDDLTGEEAEDITTVEFALEGITYEIDLADENAAKDTRINYSVSGCGPGYAAACGDGGPACGEV
jgi:hypothetical protein